MHVESYQWQIGLERILILPLAPCGFDTPYLSLPPLEIAMMIPCTWGLSSTALLQPPRDTVHPPSTSSTLHGLLFIHDYCSSSLHRLLFIEPLRGPVHPP